MAKGRKTINVELVKEVLNGHLTRTDEFADNQFKAGIAVALEKILLLTNNYDGFQYLTTDGTGNEYDRQYN
jgi:hypothetical protein